MSHRDFSLMLGVWGVSPSVGGSGASAHGMSICSFLYIFVVVMSHISTMATTTTPPVTVVSSGLSLVSSVTVAPSLMGFPLTLDLHGVALPPPFVLRGSGGVIVSVLCHSSNLHL